MSNLRYSPPTRRGVPVSHYLVAVDPGTARPGVSVWSIVREDLGSEPATPRDAIEWRPRLIGARAPRPPKTGGVDMYPGGAIAAAKLVELAAMALIFAEHETIAHLRGLLPPKIALVVEWPVNYATKTATRDDVRGLRDMIAALPWKPRPGGKPTPAEWKGNVPKEICHERTLEALNMAPSKPLDHYASGAIGRWSYADLAARGLVDDDPNARDALALGAWALGIVGRGCVR